MWRMPAMREPHAYAQVALAHAQRGVAQRVHVAPDRQRPQQQQRGRQQQAQHDPGAPGQRLVHRVIARQLHFQPLPGLAGQRHDDGLEVVAHQETGGVDLAEFVLGGLDLGVRQQPQLQAVMGQDLLQQKGGAVGGGDGVQVLVQRVHLAAHGAHGQVFDHGLDQIAQAAVHDLVRDGEADDGDDEDAEDEFEHRRRGAVGTPELGAWGAPPYFMLNSLAGLAPATPAGHARSGVGGVVLTHDRLFEQIAPAPVVRRAHVVGDEAGRVRAGNPLVAEVDGVVLARVVGVGQHVESGRIGLRNPFLAVIDVDAIRPEEHTHELDGAGVTPCIGSPLSQTRCSSSLRMACGRTCLIRKRAGSASCRIRRSGWEWMPSISWRSR